MDQCYFERRMKQYYETHIRYMKNVLLCELPAYLRYSTDAQKITFSV